MMDGCIPRTLRKNWSNKKATLCKQHLHQKCLFQWNFAWTFSEEIEFLLMCCEKNHDGKIDYIGFIDRFHEPAKEIGFNLAVLLTNLAEHMPNEPRYLYWALCVFGLMTCIALQVGPFLGNCGLCAELFPKLPRPYRDHGQLQTDRTCVFWNQRG